MKTFLKATGDFIIDLFLFPPRLVWRIIIHIVLDDFEAKRAIVKLSPREEVLEKKLLRTIFR